MVEKYIETRVTNRSNGLPNKVKSGQGSGTPIGDVKMENLAYQPVGSDYFDVDSGKQYIRKSTGWSETGGSGGGISADDYATATVGGTVKMRLDGTTLYLTNDGTDA